MIVTATVTDQTGNFAGQTDLLARNAVAAFEAWMPFLVDSGARISISLTIQAGFGWGVHGESGSGSAFQRPDLTVVVYPGAGFELRTGIDHYEDVPDIEITLGPAVFESAHINPLNGSPLPIGKVDLVSVLARQVGHALGFDGYLNWSTYQHTASYRTVYDELVKVVDGAPYFVGPMAQSVYGGPVPLTRGSPYLVGNLGREGAALGSDLMFGGPLAPGSTPVSLLDAAMLSDVGVPTLFGDELVGSVLQETMFGGGGDDRIFGGEGDDVLDGGEGSDLLRGGFGGDALRGGVAFDNMHGNQGNDSLWGGEGDDWVVGGQHSDLLQGEAGADIVHGNLGDDTALGGDGADWIRGGQDQDILEGGAGDDIIFGDRGADTLSGGLGADTFGFFRGAGLDRITDFNAAEGDRLQIEGGGSYTVTQVGADTHLDFGAGDLVILVGVSSVPPGAIALG